MIEAIYLWSRLVVLAMMSLSGFREGDGVVEGGGGRVG